MIETRVQLNTVNDIKDFVNLTNKCQEEVTIYTGRYIIDAKSFMGILSLNLSKPIKVEFEGDIPDEVKAGIAKYVVM